MLRRSFIRTAFVAAGAGAAVAVVGLLGGPSASAGYYAMSRPVDVSPHRELSWWLFAVATAIILTTAVCAGLESRRRVPVWARATIDVAVPLTLLASGVAVGTFISSSRSTATFECIIASPLLVWAPALASLLATIVFSLWQRAFPTPSN